MFGAWSLRTGHHMAEGHDQKVPTGHALQDADSRTEIVNGNVGALPVGRGRAWRNGLKRVAKGRLGQAKQRISGRLRPTPQGHAHQCVAGRKRRREAEAPRPTGISNKGASALATEAR